jgi:hypothetical protein
VGRGFKAEAACALLLEGVGLVDLAQQAAALLTSHMPASLTNWLASQSKALVRLVLQNTASLCNIVIVLFWVFALPQFSQPLKTRCPLCIFVLQSDVWVDTTERLNERLRVLTLLAQVPSGVCPATLDCGDTCTALRGHRCPTNLLPVSP